LSTQAPESAGEVGTAGTRAPPAVRLVSLRKRYGKVDAVDGVDLTVADGEFFTLLGPSGSGKTSLLRLIAGFERPDAGRVELGGEDVTFRPPYARDVNTVFQDYALFPHMTVADNIEYGLRSSACPGHSGVSGSVRRSPRCVSVATASASRRSSPAANGSGSPWPAQSSISRRCCCSTSRSARST